MIGFKCYETYGMGIINPRAVINLARSKWCHIYGNILKRGWKPILVGGDESGSYILHVIDGENGDNKEYELRPNEDVH